METKQQVQISCYSLMHHSRASYVAHWTGMDMINRVQIRPTAAQPQYPGALDRDGHD